MWLKPTVLAFAVISIAAPVLASDPLPRAAPGEVGLSPRALARIGEVLKADVDKGRIPGAVVAIARKGKLAYFEAFGFRDKTAGVPMTTDTIFSIASMTKPMTSVGILMLFEESRLLLADPVGKQLPPLADRRVAVLDEDTERQAEIETMPAHRQPTIHDLLRHTSGLTYGGRGTTSVHKMYPLSSGSSGTGMTGSEFINKLAAAPLLYQPGTVWDYSLSTDVLGLIIEALSEQTLGQFLQERLFKPLRMEDTGFLIPADKVARYARALPNDPDTGRPQAVLDSTKPLKFECGGGCAASTAGDYIRFAQMLLNKGSLDGVRILGHKMVEHMTADHLGPEVKNTIPVVSPLLPGYGFGLGVAVRKQDGLSPLVGSAGEYTWGGAYGTSFWIDPKEELAVVFMAHAPSAAMRTRYRQVLNALVTNALTSH
jgi:CubicO group peptidase (beta-lactamase class C family)